MLPYANLVNRPQSVSEDVSQILDFHPTLLQCCLRSRVDFWESEATFPIAASVSSRKLPQQWYPTRPSTLFCPTWPQALSQRNGFPVLTRTCSEAGRYHARHHSLYLRAPLHLYQMPSIGREPSCFVLDDIRILSVKEHNDFARRTNPYGLLLKRRGASVPGPWAAKAQDVFKELSLTSLACQACLLTRGT